MDETGQGDVEPWRADLKRARQKKRLSQEAAAKRANMSLSAWGGIELGYRPAEAGQIRRYRASANAVAAAAAAVGLDPLELVRSAGLDPERVDVDRLEEIGDRVNTDVRIIMIRAGVDRAEALEQIKRMLDSLEQ